ncbi:MAG: hypothetical protein RLZZ245_47 [Verrucomicrobiota bacterium]
MKPRPLGLRRATAFRKSLSFAITFAGVGAILQVDTSQAASATWNATPTNGIWEAAGAEANWSTGAGTFPGAIGTTNNTDLATFTTSSQTTISINSTAGNASPLNIGKIAITGASPSAFTFGDSGANGGNALLFTVNGTTANSSDANIYMNGTGTAANQTFNAPILLQGAAYFNNQSNSNLLVNGNISGNASGSYMLTMRGNTNSGTIFGDISNGAATALGVAGNVGSWTLAGNNSYTGTTRVNGGLITVTGVNSGGGSYEITGGTGTAITINSSGTVKASGIAFTGGSTQSRNFTLQGGIFESTGNIFGAAGAAPGGAATAATNIVFNGGTLKSGNAAGISLLDYNNTVELTGAATFDVSVGNITLGNSNFNNVNKAVMSGAGAVTVTGGNTLKAAISTAGLVTLQNNAAWDLDGTASSIAGLSGTNGSATNSGTAQTLTLNFASGTQTFGGGIGGGANVAVTKTGAGTQILTGENTYSGATTISTGTLQLGGGSTTGSLSASSSITNNGTFAVNRSNAVTQGTDFGTIVAGSGGVIQSGGGTLTLNTANTYSGTTQISSGTLVASASGALGSGTVNNGGKLQVTGGTTLNNSITTRGETNSNPSNSAGAIESTGNNTLNGNINFGNVGGLITNVISSSGALTIAGNMSTSLGSGRTFNFGGAGNTMVNGAINDGTSAVSVSKNGAGSLTLAGLNNYSGTTNISAGTLFISGEVGNSNVSVSANATIGAGDASGIIGGNLHFASGAILDLSFGILSLRDTATLSFDGFDFNNLLGFNVQSAAIGTYTLIDGDFTLNSANLAHYGIDNAFTRLDGNKAYFDEGSLTVTIAAIPEPAAALLGGLGMLVLLRRRR